MGEYPDAARSFGWSASFGGGGFAEDQHTRLQFVGCKEAVFVESSNWL
jgi:hypothetical protein